jgi:hypothetical protein
MAYAENTTATPGAQPDGDRCIEGEIRRRELRHRVAGWIRASHVQRTQPADPVRTAHPENWREYVRTPGGRSRTEAEAKKAMEAETRRRWRALALAIEAKLEVVDTGIASFEHEFGMNIA